MKVPAKSSHGGSEKPAQPKLSFVARISSGSIDFNRGTLLGSGGGSRIDTDTMLLSKGHLDLPCPACCPDGGILLLYDDSNLGGSDNARH